HAAALHRPQLPVIAEALELAVTADARAPAALDQVPDPRRVPAERILLVREPAASTRSRIATTDLVVQLLGRREVLQLLVVQVVFLRVEVVLRPGAAV